MFANVRTRTACNKTLAFYDFATATMIMLLLEAMVSEQNEVVHSLFSGYAVTKILLQYIIHIKTLLSCGSMFSVLTDNCSMGRFHLSSIKTCLSKSSARQRYRLIVSTSIR